MTPPKHMMRSQAFALAPTPVALGAQRPAACTVVRRHAFRVRRGPSFQTSRDIRYARLRMTTTASNDCFPHPNEDRHETVTTTDTLKDFGVERGEWHWKQYGHVRFFTAGDPSAPPLVLVPGFGISASDFLRNIGAIASSGYRVYAMDKLGLGESIPESYEAAQEVSLRLWRDQIISFIEQQLPNQKVFLAGNSLGGLLCASVASQRKDLLQGVLLLNPAPFWIVIPNECPTILRSMFRVIVRRFWSRLTNASVIHKTLALVYARPENIPPYTVDEILRPTRYEYAQEVFENVLMTSNLEHGFEETVQTAFGDGELPLAIVYGREDPWVVPLFGLRVKALVPQCSFYELTPCGHCAHAEVPSAVNAILTQWMQSIVDGTSAPVFGAAKSPATFGDVSVYTRDDSPRNVFERFASAQNYGLVFLAAYLSTFASHSSTR